MNIRRILVGATTLCLLGTLSGCGFFSGDKRDPDGRVTASTNIDAFSLQVGDCIITADLGDQFTEIPVVPCGEAHDAEVFHSFDMPDGDYDADELKENGNRVCYGTVKEYVGPNYYKVTELGLDVYYLGPTPSSWSNGDRTVTCIANTASGESELTSSVKGMGN
jgi:hypothetical protein